MNLNRSANNLLLFALCLATVLVASWTILSRVKTEMSKLNVGTIMSLRPKPFSRAIAPHFTPRGNESLMDRSSTVWRPTSKWWTGFIANFGKPYAEAYGEVAQKQRPGGDAAKALPSSTRKKP